MYKVESDFEYKGLKCVVIFTNLGHRCGYVGVTNDNKAYGKDEYDLDVDVHGGITYSGYSDSSNYPVSTIRDTYWLGFDCGHCDDGKDLQLAVQYGLITQVNKDRMSKFLFDEYEVKAQGYVEQECKDLVDQLLELN